MGNLEYIAHYIGARAAARWKLLELWEEIAVYKVKERLPSDAFRVGGPFAPLQVRGDGRAGSCR